MINLYTCTNNNKQQTHTQEEDNNMMNINEMEEYALTASLSRHLTRYPDIYSPEEIIQMILEGSDDVLVCEDYEWDSPEDLVAKIRSEARGFFDDYLHITGVRDERQYCDHCGEKFKSDTDMHPYQHLPIAVASANAGESAVLCWRCDNRITRIVVFRRNIADAARDVMNGLWKMEQDLNVLTDFLDYDIDGLVVDKYPFHVDIEDMVVRTHEWHNSILSKINDSNTQEVK